MDDRIPGEKPIDIEMAFGDPEAIDKAKANTKLYPYCTKQNIHCPWIENCIKNGQGQCPIEIDGVNILGSPKE